MIADSLFILESFRLRAEEGEIDAAVLAVLQEVGVLGEIVVLAVFEDEEAVRLEQAAIDDEVGQCGELLQGIRRVGKDEVELLVAGLDEAEDVAADGYHLGDSPPVIRFATHRGDSPLCGRGGRPSAEFLQAVLDEAVVVTVELNTDNAGTTTREQFERDAARA